MTHLACQHCCDQIGVGCCAALCVLLIHFPLFSLPLATILVVSSGGVLSVMSNYGTSYGHPTSPATSRGFAPANSPGALDMYPSQENLGYVQATSPQPSGFPGLTVSSEMSKQEPGLYLLNQSFTNYHTKIIPGGGQIYKLNHLQSHWPVITILFCNSR